MYNLTDHPVVNLVMASRLRNAGAFFTLSVQAGRGPSLVVAHAMDRRVESDRRRNCHAASVVHDIPETEKERKSE